VQLSKRGHVTQRNDETKLNPIKVFLKLVLFDAGLFVKSLPNLPYWKFDNVLYLSTTYNGAYRVRRVNEETGVLINGLDEAPSQFDRLASIHNLIGVLGLNTDQDIVLDRSALIHIADSESVPIES
jgi:hypothetical protein